MATEIELWKNIEGFDGLYEISNFGRIKSNFKYRKNSSNIKSLNSFDQKGYVKVGLSYKAKNIKNECHGIHRLVALHFIPNPENKPQVNHKDCNKKNNHVDNLEWVTHSENMKHAWENGLQKGRTGQFGVNHPISRKINQIKDGVVIKTYDSIKSMHEITGVNKSMMYKAMKKKEEYKGYIWEHFK